MARIGKKKTSLRSGWKNQKIRLFHGTLKASAVAIAKHGIQLALCRPLTDFGQGFYTTTSLRQARKWARQMAKARPGSAAAVLLFRVDRNALARLESIGFVRGQPDAGDYWRFVSFCRSGGVQHGRKRATSGWYDMAIGPVALNWKQRIVYVNMDQISFHTPVAIALLSKSALRMLP
jgi:hypothetical protein